MVETGHFRGEATCYAAQGQLETFVDDLARFSQTLEGRATFDAGFSDGSKAVRIDVYTIDLARHVAVRVQLATESFTRVEEVARLAVEFRTEPVALDDFVLSLRQVRAVRDAAFLREVSTG